MPAFQRLACGVLSSFAFYLALGAVSPGGGAEDRAYQAFQQGQYLTALHEAERDAARGEASAHTLIGRIHAEGLGVARDFAKAAEAYEKGAELGDVGAQFALGVLLAQGRGVKQDRKRAAILFEKVARTGHSNAQYNLALLYIEGRAREQDLKRAAALLQKAAANGHTHAQYDLGGLYAMGKGVEKDDDKAAHWTKQAAVAGLAVAELEYAMMLIKGRGVTKDVAQAADFLKFSAQKGNPVAQNRLANLFARGQGVKIDAVEAVKWHLLARESGVSDFQLDLLLDALSKLQRQAAEKGRRQVALKPPLVTVGKVGGDCPFRFAFQTGSPSTTDACGKCCLVLFPHPTSGERSKLWKLGLFSHRSLFPLINQLA